MKKNEIEILLYTLTKNFMEGQNLSNHNLMATKVVIRGKEVATLKNPNYITSKKERSCKI